MEKKRYLLLWMAFLISAVLPTTAEAQVADSTYAALYAVLPQHQVRHIIRTVARREAVKKGIDTADINARLAAAMEYLEMALVSGLSRNSRIPPANATVAQRKAFVEVLVRETGRMLASEHRNMKYLFVRDYSDRILSFHADIKVHADGKIEVIENITIYNGNGDYSPDIDYAFYTYPNNDIQRGIVRDFPTDYVAKDGFWMRVPFDVKAVRLNGQVSPHLRERLDNGERIMVGEESKMLPQGIHTYTFHYTTQNQLIYHDNKDEIYWNVNGTGWVFSADSISCTIQFPYGSQLLEEACYTGFQGSTDRNCNARRLSDSSIHFFTTQRMESYQGLTVAAAIAKGVLLPGPERNFVAIVRDNKGAMVLPIVVLFLALFYSWHWHKHGRDPKKGTIYPQLDPPAGLSPADVGFIATQQYGSHLFAAALVDLAVKKLLHIEVESKRVLVRMQTYHFKKPAGVNLSLAGSSKQLYGFDVADLYGDKAERGVYNSDLKKKYDTLSGHLKNRFEIRKGKQNTWHGLFVRNDGYTIFGGFLIFMSFAYTFFHLVMSYTPNILALAVLCLVLMIIVQSIFVKIMSAYTEKGRAIADHIEGFKMYLETAEQKLYEYLTPPEKNLALFEKYLPYAIALKVENSWAQKFDNIVQKAIEGGYQPTYYRSMGGQSFSRSFSMGDISRGVSSGLSSTVASASTPPSSSGGGSGGGGSSGGGGGGGGGGGW